MSLLDALGPAEWNRARRAAPPMWAEPMLATLGPSRDQLGLRDDKDPREVSRQRPS